MISAYKTTKIKDTAPQRFLVFFVGILIPFISFRTSFEGTTAGFSERITLADIFVIILIGIFILRGIKLHISAVVYGISLLISLLVANSLATGAGEWEGVLVSGISMFVALGYWMVGYNVSFSRNLSRYLLLGLALGLILEFLIVFHDYFSVNQIFVDPLEGRVRGTFRASGQLGAYGFGMVGLILIIGYNWVDQRRTKFLILVLCLSSLFIVIASSRRSAIFALGCWLLLYVATTFFHFKFRYWLVVFALFMISILVLNTLTDETQTNFTLQRIVAALESLETTDNFTMAQFEAATDTVSIWFPIGIGIGRWLGNYEIYELHNAHLALIVEIGLLGIISFYWLMLLPILRNNQMPVLVKYAIISFIFASMIFMIHNRMFRERLFMLLLGLLTNYASFSTKAINSESVKTP